MAISCTCISGLGNTGLPNCLTAFDVAKKLILVPYFKADGSVNGIDLTGLTEIDQAFLDSKFYANDPDERWYPTPELKNVTDERADDIVEEFEDGTQAFIQEGARSFSGFIVGGSPAFKGQIDAWRCKTVGVYFVDKSGNLIGNDEGDGQLNPIRVADETLSVTFVKTTDTTIQKIQIRFNVDSLMDDADISLIESANITGNLKGANGLLDALSANVINITVNGFKCDFVTRYGGVLSRTPVQGLDDSDFELFNETQSSAVALTSVTEDPAGTYDFVYTAPVTAADVIRVGNQTSGELSKGYDVVTFTVVTP